MQSRCHAIELSFHEQRECWLSINWISLLYYISLHRTALYCTVFYFKSISNKYTFKTNANPYTLFLINKKLHKTLFRSWFRMGHVLNGRWNELISMKMRSTRGRYLIVYRLASNSRDAKTHCRNFYLHLHSSSLLQMHLKKMIDILWLHRHFHRLLYKFVFEFVDIKFPFAEYILTNNVNNLSSDFWKQMLSRANIVHTHTGKTTQLRKYGGKSEWSICQTTKSNNERKNAIQNAL